MCQTCSRLLQIEVPVRTGGDANVVNLGCGIGRRKWRRFRTYLRVSLLSFPTPALCQAPFPSEISLPLWALLVLGCSRSPETRALFTGDRSPAPMRTAGTGGDGPVKTNALVNRHSTGGSNPVTLIFSPRHARTSLYDSSDGGGDVDSVVFGSAGGGYGEGSPGSVVPPSAGSGRNTARNTKAPTQGQQGADETAIRQGGGGRDTSLRAGGDDDELYFDPVLNCYYDRAANKYYGLR